MNKLYENPEAKVVYFQATEKLALNSNEDDGISPQNSILNPSITVNQGNKPGQG